MESYKRYIVDFTNGKISNEDGTPVENNSGYENGMKLAVVGSRSIDSEKLVKRVLNAWRYIFGTPQSAISGGAAGVDTIAEKWADSIGISIEVIKPDWEADGRSAGFKRNREIVSKCDMCLAIWDGESHGTEDDINISRELKKPLVVFNKREMDNGTFTGFLHITYTREDSIVDAKPKRATLTPKPSADKNNWLPKPFLISI